MAFFAWDQRLSLGNQQIDGHHRHLIGLINKLYDNYSVAEAERVSLDGVVAELIDYATYHFAAEEELMKAHAYPGTDDHVREHRGFQERVMEYDRRSSGARKLISSEVLVFLRDWLTSHIQEIDGQLGRFLKDKGVA